MSTPNTFTQAVAELGGQKVAAQILGRAQSTISAHCQSGKPPADLCMRVEIETGGKFRAEKLRPDLAETFQAFRKASQPAKRRRAA